MLDFFRPKIPASTDVRIDGRTVAVAVRVSVRAKSYRLSIPASGHPVLTVPRHGRWPDAKSFLERHTGWLAARLKRVPAATGFGDGALVPLRGVPHRILATGSIRGTVTTEAGDGVPLLLVPGAPEHRTRRLVDWLRAEAGRDLSARCAVHAATLGVTVTGMSLRDQSTRWGSCSSTGRLNFNWRLVLAPPHVLDYVAAHEVAHLVEMNHSPAFWRTCERALPDMARGRAWLKAHGRELMAYGFEPA